MLITFGSLAGVELGPMLPFLTEATVRRFGFSLRRSLGSFRGISESDPIWPVTEISPGERAKTLA